MADNPVTLPPETDAAPTFDEAIAQAAAVYREARASIGMDAAAQLISIGDSWQGLAAIIDRRDRGLDYA